MRAAMARGFIVMSSRVNASLWWQYIVPQHGLSRLVSLFAYATIPWLKNFFIKRFIIRYGVDMSQAQQPDPQQYPHFNAFFTRAIRPELRPIVVAELAIASPVDGCISQIGVINEGQIIQAKGFDFSLLSLLGGSEKWEKIFKAGSFATLYLAPKDYHRVHMPWAGQLQEMIYIPGHLFSVNCQSVAGIPNLFARNERVVTCYSLADGSYMAVILVGALIVASIETVWAGLIAPNRKKAIQTWHYPNEPRNNAVLKKGDELGRFQLGSTVIVLFSSPKIEWSADAVAGRAVIMGEKLGTRSE
jgi:phosphatidylserine decarboxylase